MIFDAVGVLIFGAIGWFTLEFFARPMRDFFDLRRRVRREMLKFEMVWNADDIIAQVTSYKEQDNLRELSAELISFGQSEWLAAKALTSFGFNPVLAGQQLSTFAVVYGPATEDRSASYRSVLEALKFPAQSGNVLV
jgi:hypothetical protein